MWEVWQYKGEQNLWEQVGLGKWRRLTKSGCQTVRSIVVVKKSRGENQLERHVRNLDLCACSLKPVFLYRLHM